MNYPNYPGISYPPKCPYDKNAIYGQIQHLSRSELENYLRDEEALAKLVEDLEPVKNRTQEKENLASKLKVLAQENMNLRPKLEVAKTTLAEHYTDYTNHLKDFEKAKLQLDTLASFNSPDTSLNLLKAEAAKVEESTDQIGEDFLGGKKNVQQFLEEYISQRTRNHTLRLKVDKLEEQLSNNFHQPTFPTQPTQNIAYPIYNSPGVGGHYQPYQGGYSNNVPISMPDPSRHLKS